MTYRAYRARLRATAAELSVRLSLLRQLEAQPTRRPSLLRRAMRNLLRFIRSISP